MMGETCGVSKPCAAALALDAIVHAMNDTMDGESEDTLADARLSVHKGAGAMRRIVRVHDRLPT